MNEYNLIYLAIAALIVCVVDCLFWSLGGRNGKWKRRYVGAALQTLGLNILSIIGGTWAWQYVLSLGPEIGSRCMGYGGDTTGEKIMRRSVFALGSIGVGAILAWGAGFTGGAIIVLVCQVIASIVSIILGVKNPFPAAVEEVFVCLSLKYLNYGYIFVGMMS